MPLGDLYNYITIETYTASDSSYGDDDTFTWSTYASCWAERVQEQPIESIYREQTMLKDSVSWKVRFDSGITEMMRIYFDGLYYQITGIEIEGRRKFLKLRGYKYLNT